MLTTSLEWTLSLQSTHRTVVQWMHSPLAVSRRGSVSLLHTWHLSASLPGICELPVLLDSFLPELECGAECAQLPAGGKGVSLPPFVSASTLLVCALAV
mmetsp:Transcript_2915/g.4427  ORF Transcript_2915/g.4427 Transcript_2915/m.4427 type:complete len:99 (+) Transcript_2915:172-468(+)